MLMFLFKFALTREYVVNFIRATNKMQHGGDARRHPRAGYGQAGTIGGVEQLGDVAALLEVVLRRLIRRNNVCHTMRGWTKRRADSIAAKAGIIRALFTWENRPKS